MKILLVLFLAIVLNFACSSNGKKDDTVQPPVVVEPAPEPTPVPVVIQPVQGAWAFTNSSAESCTIPLAKACFVGDVMTTKVGGKCQVAKCVEKESLAQVNCTYQTASGTDFSPSRVGSKCDPKQYDTYYICYCPLQFMQKLDVLFL